MNAMEDLINDICNFFIKLSDYFENLCVLNSNLNSNGGQLAVIDFSNNLYDLYYKLSLDSNRLKGMIVGDFDYPDSFNINIKNFNNYLIKVNKATNDNKPGVHVTIYRDGILMDENTFPLINTSKNHYGYQSLINELYLIQQYVEDY